MSALKIKPKAGLPVHRPPPDPEAHVIVNPAIRRLQERKREDAACNEWMIKLEGQR